MPCSSAQACKASDVVDVRQSRSSPRSAGAGACRPSGSARPSPRSDISDDSPRPPSDRSRVGTRREGRSQKRQQGEAGRPVVGHAQFLVTPVVGKRARSEPDRDIAGLDHALALNGKQHQIGGAVTVRGQRLARTQTNDSDVGLRAFENRICHQSVTVVSRGIVQSDDLHRDSIARHRADPRLGVNACSDLGSGCDRPRPPYRSRCGRTMVRRPDRIR
jgi:hypothetical protein